MHDAIQLEAQLPPLRRPIVVAAFWGFGDGTGSAVATLRHIRELRDAPEVATVDPDRFYDLSVARPRTAIEEGVRTIRWPGTRFYLVQAEERDVVLLSGREPSIAWRTYCEAVASFMSEIGSTELVALGSFGAATPHTRPAPVWLIQAHHHLEELLRRTAQHPRYEGPTDIASTLIAHLQGLGWHTARLTALVPHYISFGPNPGAQIALLESIDGPLGLNVPVRSLERARTEFDERVNAGVAELDDAPRVLEHIAELEQLYDEGGLQSARRFEDGQPEGQLPDAAKLVEGIEELLRKELGESNEPD